MFIPIRRIGCLFVTMSTDLFSLLRFYIQLIYNVKHSVCRNNIIICFGYTLCIYTMTDIGELSQNIKAVKNKGKVAVQDTAFKACVPHKFIGVQLFIVITITAV